jgi:hypothetical protein
MLGDFDAVLRKVMARQASNAIFSFGLSLIILPLARFGGIDLAGMEIAY